MTYLEYRHRVEFNKKEYDEINDFCKKENIDWFVSVWDMSSIDFIEKYNPIAVKIPSDKMNDYDFLKKVKKLKCPIIMSSGGSNYNILDEAIDLLGTDNNALLQCTSIYPCETNELNLSVIKNFAERYKITSGLSTHHTSPIFGAFSLAYGSKIVEQHITLNRANWGTDQAASLSENGIEYLTSVLRGIPSMLGDGKKKYLQEEKKISKKQRYW